MKKSVGILCAMAILIGIPVVTKAAAGDSEAEDKAIKSYGSIIYEDKNGSVKIYAEDINLLQEKLSSIPDEIFDPVLYSHNHVWEYRDVTDQSHTKHCDICGSKYDVTNMHSEILEMEKDCTITFGGHDYPGVEKTCECGYTWIEETAHTMVYTQKDDMCHIQSCALDGTPFCTGLEEADLAHMITLIPTDGTHHQQECFDCGYQGDIEECVFEFDLPEELEKAYAAEARKYCACGNYTTESKTEMEVTDSAATVTEPDMLQTGTEMEEPEQPGMEETGEKTEASDAKAPIPEAPLPSISENDLENGMQDKTEETMMMEEKGENNL